MSSWDITGYFFDIKAIFYHSIKRFSSRLHLFPIHTRSGEYNSGSVNIGSSEFGSHLLGKVNGNLWRIEEFARTNVIRADQKYIMMLWDFE